MIVDSLRLQASAIWLIRKACAMERTSQRLCFLVRVAPGVVKNECVGYFRIESTALVQRY